MVILSFLGWIVVGLIVGFVASRAVNLRGDDPRLGIGVAAGAALVGAVLYSLIGGGGLTVWDPWGLLYAGAGAVVGVVIWHAVRSRTISKADYTRRSSY